MEYSIIGVEQKDIDRIQKIKIMDFYDGNRSKTIQGVNMRRIIAIAILLAVLISGCGKAARSDKVQIRFWHGLSGPLGDVLNEMIVEFNKTHPNIEVITNPISSYTALSQKLSAALQVGKQPDLAQVFESWSAKYQKDHVLVSIDSLITNDKTFTQEDLNDFYPVFMQSITYQGKKWSFPFNKSVRAYFYNKDAFYRAGKDPNKFPATWEEFHDYCRDLTTPETKDHPATFGANFTVNEWQFVNLLYQAGGRVMDANDKPVLNGPEGVEAMTYVLNMVNKEKIAKASKEMDGQNAFLAGTVAMFEGSSVSITYMRQEPINFNIGYAPLPTHKTDISAISGANIVIFKSGDSKREQAAWEFIKWFTDTEQTAKWSARTCYMPLRQSAMQTPTIQNFLNQYPQFRAIYAQLEHASFEPQHPAWFIARDELKKALEKAKEGKLTPQQALDELAKKLADLIKKENTAPSLDKKEPSKSTPVKPSQTPTKPEQKIVWEPVHFGFDQALISSADRLMLDKLAETLKKSPSVRILIKGNTDSVGQPDYNVKLAENRATSVRDYLKSRGILENRMEIKAFGSSNPVETNTTVTGREKNRRVDFEVLQ